MNVTDCLFSRIFTCQQFIQLIAAHMAEVLSLHGAEDVFADIPAVVTDMFDGTCAEQRGQHAWNGTWVFHHISHQLAHDAFIFLVSFLIFAINTHCFAQTHTCKRIQNVMQHLYGMAAQ